MKNIEKIKINPKATIRKALMTISKGGYKIAIVVDQNDKLLGTLTDGDIRRGFLKGLNLNSPIETIVFKKPTIAKKNDNKKKLLKIAISKKIFQIPIVDDYGKVIGIHYIDELLKNKNKLNKVVIMAGGKGKRLRPLTNKTPKPMLKVGNKPILQIIIEKFKKSGFKNFIICLNYKSQVIKNYFRNGEKLGVNIEYLKEDKRMGTAGALSLIKKKPKEPFFVINGDILTNLDFEKMLDFHNKYNSKATMCIADFNFNSPYGEVKIKNENIISITEKPQHKFFINTGIYILDPKSINLVTKEFFDMPLLFKKMIEKKYKIISFPLGEYWMDIGRLEDYKKANENYQNL